MKIYKYLLLLCMLVVMGACNRSDDADSDVILPDAPTFDTSTTYGARMKDFYDKYGIWCQYNVSKNDLQYEWTTSDNWTTSSPDYEFVDVTKPEYITKALDMFESLMKSLPEDILKKYIGMNIAFEEKMYNTYTLDNNLNYKTIDDFPGLTLQYQEPRYGWISARYLILAPAGPDIDTTDKTAIERQWTSLIMQKALDNLPNADDFEKANASAFSFTIYTYEHFIEGNHKDGWYYNSYLGSQQCPYLDGLVGTGEPWGYTLFDDYDNKDTKTGYYAGIDKTYGNNTWKKAFADLVGYIMFAPTSEKTYIRSFSDKVLKNEAMIKAYCKKYLNWDIPELNQ